MSRESRAGAAVSSRAGRPEPPGLVPRRSRRGSAAGRLLLAAGLGLAVGCGPGPLPPLEPLAPIPTTIGEAARQQLESQRQRVDALLADRDATAAGHAVGRLGQLYHAYRLFDDAVVCYRNAGRLLPEEVRWWHLQGLAQGEQGDHDGAAESFRRGLELQPENRLLRLRLAESELGRGAGAAAREEATRALGDRQLDPSVHLLLGRISLAEGDPEVAVDELRQVLELRPDASRVHYTLALALREAGRFDEAREHLALQGSVEVAIPDPLAEGLEELATSSGAYLSRGNRALMANRLEEARAAYEQAVAGAPESPEPRRNLALALLRLGDAEGAVRELETALALTPRDPGLHFDLGNAQAARQDVEPAIQAFRAALALAPDYSEARFNLANVLLRAGRWREAQRELSQVLDQAPGDSRARYQLAMVSLQLGAPGEAKRSLFELLQREPQSVIARLGLAEVLALEGARAEAEAQLDEASELATSTEERADVGLARARLALAGGDAATAIEQARRALEHRPGDPEANRVLADGLVAAGYWSEARAQLEAIASDPRAALTLAKVLAAAPQARVRDGARSQVIAQRLVAAQPSIEHGEAYAMALAELGQLDQAAALAERLVAQARAASRGVETVSRLERQLEDYRAGRPHRLGAP